MNHPGRSTARSQRFTPRDSDLPRSAPPAERPAGAPSGSASDDRPATPVDHPGTRLAQREDAPGSDERYTPVCALADIDREAGVAALVDGEAVAVFRTYDDRVYALSNYDPFGRASVLARGIVGTRGDIPFVASPLHKQGFDLRTGRCLDDETVRVPTYEVLVSDGVVLVGGPRE